MNPSLSLIIRLSFIHFQIQLLTFPHRQQPAPLTHYFNITTANTNLYSYGSLRILWEHSLLIQGLSISTASQLSYRPKQILIKEWKKKFLCTRHQSPQESRIRVVSCSDSAGSSVRRRLSPGWQFHSLQIEIFADCRVAAASWLAECRR